MPVIRVYQTHIEVSPYHAGDWPQLERFYSVFAAKYGRKMIFKPFCYHIEGDTLYLPKGTNILTIENYYRTNVTYERTTDPWERSIYPYELKTPIKAKQSDAVDFISSSGTYKHTVRHSQFILQLPTGFGKTFCCIAGVVRMGVKTVVIVNRELLIEHWKAEFLKHTTIPEKRIIGIQGSDAFHQLLSGELEGDIYLITHQAISAAARTHGREYVQSIFKAMKVGIKIVDEVHEFLESTVKIDCMSNTTRNIYLSGTLTRSKYAEAKVMRSVFASASRYELPESYGKLENSNLIYRPTYYRSQIPDSYIIMMKGKYGFNAHKYIIWSIEQDESEGLVHALCDIMDTHVYDTTGTYPGQILLVSPAKRSVEYFYRLLKHRYGRTCKVGKIYSDATAEEREDAMTAKIISSTIKSCGTGFNLNNLQTVVCVEPHSSPILTKQLKGRLDRYSVPGLNTYFYDLFDKKIPYFEEMEKIHMKVLKNYIKEVEPLQY